MTPRSWLQRRQRGQNIVEFGFIVAAVAVVGMLGLQAVTMVQKVYFGDVAAVLSLPAATVPGDVLHTVGMAMTCVPSTTVLVGTTATCTVTITDLHAGPSTPQGSVQTNVSSGPPPSDCGPLLPTGSGDAASCVFTFSPTLSQVGSLTIDLKYTAKNSGHLNQEQTFPLTVAAIPSLTVNCTNDALPGLGASVEIGHPIDCAAVLTMPGQGGGVSGQLSWNQVSGVAGTFACSVTNTQSCTPASGRASTATCTTDSTGKCRIIFRPGLTVGQDSVQVAFGGADKFGAVTSDPITINVVAPVGPHPTSVSFSNCTQQEKDGNEFVHCQITVSDTDGPPASADADDRIPPTGAVTITATPAVNTQFKNNTCGSPNAFPPDHSTCFFDFFADEGDDDADLTAQYGGDVVHQPSSVVLLHVQFSHKGGGGPN